MVATKKGKITEIRKITKNYTAIDIFTENKEKIGVKLWDTHARINANIGDIIEVKGRYLENTVDTDYTGFFTVEKPEDYAKVITNGV